MVPLYSSKISRVPLYSRVLINITFTGLSPSVVSFSKLFKFFYQNCWPSPVSLATTNGISIDFFSSGYLDVSVLQVVSLNLCIQFKVPHKVVGFPIRKSRIKLIDSKSELIAVCHVLHRLFLPRHPPNALTRLNY